MDKEMAVGLTDADWRAFAEACAAGDTAESFRDAVARCFVTRMALADFNRVLASGTGRERGVVLDQLSHAGMMDGTALRVSAEHGYYNDVERILGEGVVRYSEATDRLYVDGGWGDDALRDALYAACQNSQIRSKLSRVEDAEPLEAEPPPEAEPPLEAEPLLEAEPPLEAVDNYVRVVELLLAAGADCRAGGSEALFLACESGNGEVVKVLLRAGADIHAIGDRAFILACVRGDAAIVQCLLDAGADPLARNGTARLLAIVHGHQALAERLDRMEVEAKARALEPPE